MPIDNTPHAGEVLHKPDKRFPTPSDAPDAQALKTADPINGRPAIPANSHTTAVDVEDEEADPVVESGPGVDVKQTSLFTKD